MRKALEEVGTTGGRYFPIKLSSDTIAWGADRYAMLDGEDITSEGSFDGRALCLVSKKVGKGMVFYNGTNLGRGAAQGMEGFVQLLLKATRAADLKPTLDAQSQNWGQVHLDLLEDQGGTRRFIMAYNRSDEPQKVTVNGSEKWKGIFTGKRVPMSGKTEITFDPDSIDLLMRDEG